MPEHQTTIVSVLYAWTEAGQQWGYRALCNDCSWKGRKVPQSQKSVAETQARQHTSYHADVARLTGR